MKLKLLSWNIWGGRHIDGVVEFLKSVDADIIALQEVIREENGNTALTIVQRLAEYGLSPIAPAFALDMKISSKWTGPVREKEEMLMYGNAILTKHKIVNSKADVISSGENRKALSADILINGLILHVWSVHLKHLHVTQNDPAIVTIHNEQADTLLSLLPKEKAVVMGDFNNTPGSTTINKMKSVLSDAEDGPSAPTWTAYPGACSVCPPDNSQYKFDYIFTTKDLKIQEFKVGDTKASDHLPVFTTIEI